LEQFTDKCVNFSSLATFRNFLNKKKISLQCFDAVGWVAGRASGL